MHSLSPEDLGQQFYAQDDCPECSDGHMVVYASRVREVHNEPMRLRYLRCSREECRYKPQRNKVFIPLHLAPEIRGHRSRTNRIKMRRLR